MLVRPKLEFFRGDLFGSLYVGSKYAARFVANDHKRTTSPTTLVLTLNWQTIERRRIIKQAMTFYNILNRAIRIGNTIPKEITEKHT